MSNFRIVILVLLVVALAVLGLIYVNLSGRMDVLQQQQQLAVSSSAPAANAPSPYLPMPTQAAPASMQPAVVADPVMVEELAHATAELERMKKENEDLRRRQDVAEQETCPFGTAEFGKRGSPASVAQRHQGRRAGGPGDGIHP